MSENIFDGATTPTEPVAPPQPTLPTEVAELVGEGKKYRTAEDALKALPHAQSHIKTLEEEAKQLREELAKRKAAEELLEEFKATGHQPAPVDKQAPAEPVNVEEIVASVLAKREAQTTAQKNVATVVNTFKETFGDKDKAEEVYNRVAAENGLSVVALNNLAATSPEAVLRLAGITKKQESIPGKIQSTVNTQSFSDKPNTQLSAKVKPGASSREVTAAWRAAGEMVKMEINNS